MAIADRELPIGTLAIRVGEKDKIYRKSRISDGTSYWVHLSSKIEYPIPLSHLWSRYDYALVVKKKRKHRGRHA